MIGPEMQREYLLVTKRLGKRSYFRVNSWAQAKQFLKANYTDPTTGRSVQVKWHFTRLVTVL